DGVNEIGGDQGNEHRHDPNAGVAEHGGVDQTIQFFVLVRGRILGDVAHDGRTYAQVEQTVVSGDREDQDPQTKSVIPQAVQDERGKEDSHHDVHAQGEPTRSHVLKNLAFVEFHEPGCSDEAVTREGGCFSVVTCAAETCATHSARSSPKTRTCGSRRISRRLKSTSWISSPVGVLFAPPIWG